ncbi:MULTISPECIES: phosphonate metabolism protein/1,5-bisphosphokinase (PRPP-forming) PhnN [unclassified Caballeronia]|uniref:phosphonate metabolism protein/1,5-bisphosphokinase (PRPP-forming) PhnN n=1 Tax=unclassified Caballeronia TaxID=2646786 RepID=UPI002027F6B7|nr:MULTISPECIES: phosphonate metabolism protein/1,5-bisphosphokinase (PRPP-forming) PhnN [unclassified Caballeronia]MDR5801351.1 phosphonate metabolism protein/1,5-bisphosphokinase (PRPP-forming) PhnN [Caballeronia sp. LZ001]
MSQNDTLDSARLIYVMGPSGAGKDSLLGFARERVGARVMFAHRYITRAVGDGENHIALTHEEFKARLSYGLFSMHWESHGLCYGIGIEVDAWLERGRPVVVNGSRQHADAALARYPHACFVYIDAAPAVLAARLARRGREDARQIEARLARRPSLELPRHARVVNIDNSGLLADAGTQFLRAIEETGS